MSVSKSLMLGLVSLCIKTSSRIFLFQDQKITEIQYVKYYPKLDTTTRYISSHSGTFYPINLPSRLLLTLQFLEEPLNQRFILDVQSDRNASAIFLAWYSLMCVYRRIWTTNIQLVNESTLLTNVEHSSHNRM